MSARPGRTLTVAKEDGTREGATARPTRPGASGGEERAGGADAEKGWDSFRATFLGRLFSPEGAIFGYTKLGPSGART